MEEMSTKGDRDYKKYSDKGTLLPGRQSRPETLAMQQVRVLNPNHDTFQESC